MKLNSTDAASNSGGAMYNLATVNGECKPLIINSLFRGNKGFSGGAVYNLAGNDTNMSSESNASPAIKKLYFLC